MSDLHQEDGDQESTQSDGSEDSEQAEVEALKILNEKTGRNYKSFDDVSKTFKEASRIASQQGREEKSKPTHQEKGVDNTLLEELFIGANPEAQHVWERVKTEAKRLDTSPYSLWKESEFFRSEAKHKALQLAQDEENKRKTSNSSSDAIGNREISEMTEEEIKKMPSSELAKLYGSTSKPKYRF